MSSLPPPRKITPMRNSAEPVARIPEMLVWVMQGRVVRCGHCGSMVFTQRKHVLNFLRLEKMATVLECGGCSHLEWFSRSPVQEYIPMEPQERFSRLE